MSEQTPQPTADDFDRIAARLIDEIPGFLGETPDPWPADAEEAVSPRGLRCGWDTNRAEIVGRVAEFLRENASPARFTLLAADHQRITAEHERLSVSLATAQQELRDASSVCACGCPDAEHESYEEGLSCANDQHDCVRTSAAVLSMLTNLRGSLATAQAEIADARDYLTQLFKVCAPQCRPNARLLTLCTQIDNYIAGLRDRNAALEAEHQQGQAALRSLRNEVAGLLGAWWNDLVEAIGITNVRCLERRRDEADALLKSAPERERRAMSDECDPANDPQGAHEGEITHLTQEIAKLNDALQWKEHHRTLAMTQWGLETDRAEKAEAQLTAIRSALQTKIEQWRQRAASQGAIYGSGLADAADDLETWLSASSDQPEKSK